MSHIVKISGKPRASVGTSQARRLRTQGLVPANVYGHKQDSANIVLESDAITGLIKSGARVVDLDIEGTSEKALLKSVQWDTFSTHVLHVDFLRVDINERVRLDVPIQLRGTAPGVVAGGVLEVPHHTLTIECLAVEVPDNIQVRIASLNLGEFIHVSDLQDVPPGVTVLTPPETVLVHVAQLQVAPEAEAPAEEKK
ncbi:MAG TPA: 50S ribosomal protein L25 [Planctomicrobium sp.]|nr:50S ribosomal protein L25 [Planctomicrobium sp.]